MRLLPKTLRDKWFLAGLVACVIAGTGAWLYSPTQPKLTLRLPSSRQSPSRVTHK
jgi:hypothetical protein